VLHKYLEIDEQITELKGKIKLAAEELEEILIEQYENLSEEEIIELIVELKWMTAIELSVQSELERISQRLTQRVKELAERYETTLPEQNALVSASEEKVNTHLSKMGFAWS
jgi:type I restriction enzyme M protein